MKKFLFLAAFLLLAAMRLVAADVDAAAARAIALRYFQNVASTRHRGAPVRTSDVRLAHAEMNSANIATPVYYIFNTSDGYVIVSGDDRARSILAHGDGALDMNKIPCNMRAWLDVYKEQLEYLQAHPGLAVESNAPRRSSSYYSGESVEPLLKEMWDQSDPYFRETPVSNGMPCLTGCGATSLSMIFHHWKYPTGEIEPVPAYTTGSGMAVPALPATSFDWDNMLDQYHGNNFTSEQASAVAHLMRYVGQSERMDYGTSSSGTGSYDILRTVRRFGYDPDAQLVSKESWWGDEDYNDEDWGAIIQEELLNGRPILMCAYTHTWSGHAFNIDGYNADEDTYHINWGWSGSSNNYFVLNAFKGGGMTYDVGQQLIIGIEPPATEPTIKPQFSRIRTQAYVDSTSVTSLRVKGALLTSDVTLTLDDASGFFSIDTERISLDQLQAGKLINISYTPTAVGEHHATVTLKSDGCSRDKVINLFGSCLLETYNPVMLEATDVTLSSFNVQWQDATPKHNVASYNLEITSMPFNELRLEESFDKTENSGTSSSDCSSKLDEITHLPGWTGSKLYRTNTDLLMGTSKSGGWIKSPAIDMYGNNGKITVKVTAKSSSEGDAPLKIYCGDKDTTINVGSELAQYSVLLPCPAIENATVRLANAASKRVVLCDIQVLAGDDFSPIDMSRAIYKQGITSTSYVIDNMAAGYYGLRVQTLYTDSTLSPWSNVARVYLPWEKGDINHDGEINIADANQIIEAIMQDITSIRAIAVCDLNDDGEINIADINSIIDMIMGKR